MSKTKYYYDSETLSYRKLKPKNTFFRRIINTFISSEYRIVILKENTFEEKFLLRYSHLKGFFILILLMITSFLFILLLIYNTGLKSYFSEFPDISINYSISMSIMTIIVISIILAYTLKLIYSYLKETQLNENEKKVVNALEIISKNINSMLEKINKGDEKIPSVAELTNYIKKEVINSSNKAKTNTLDKSFLTNDKEVNKKLILDFQFLNNIKSRFENLVEISLRRANVNLLIGISITLVAFIGIGITLFNNELSIVNKNIVLDYFLPRFLILAFVQVFAFFFLKNYRSNLLDIKYYQNEITNIELKYLGLFHNAISDNDNFCVSKELLRTEKNSALNLNDSFTKETNSSEIETVISKVLEKKI